MQGNALTQIFLRFLDSLTEDTKDVLHAQRPIDQQQYTAVQYFL